MEEADWFDEDAYLELHLDVAQAIKAGLQTSAEMHFREYGRKEGRALRSRTNQERGRILICGTGRAGTTLLVQLFAALSFNTGFSRDQVCRSIDGVSHAGLEHVLSHEAPLVVKSPWLVQALSSESGLSGYRISFIIIPMRNLKDAAESRRRVSRVAYEQGKDPLTVQGGLWLTSNPSEQEAVLAEQFYNTVFSVVRSRIQPLFLEFPKFAEEPGYLKDALRPLWSVYGVSSDELEAALDSVVNIGKIHLR